MAQAQKSLKAGGHLKAVIEAIADRLAASDLCFGHGVDNPLDEAIWLVCERANIDLNTLDDHLNDSVEQGLVDQLEKDLVSRIEQRKPMAYIAQSAYLSGFRFYVDERVIIPRSPIAELIEQGFYPWLEHLGDQPFAVLDMCTGSGCLAILMEKYLNCQVDAVDISPDALAVAKMNKAELGSGVNLIESDLFSALEGKTYDLIVSNPPYVDDHDFQSRPDEFHHEPDIALHAQDEGLAIALKIIEAAKTHLNPKGVLIVEVGNSQAAMMRRYPDAPLIWLAFERGGEGVFLLRQEDLVYF